jgi:hypothetical protein
VRFLLLCWLQIFYLVKTPLSYCRAIALAGVCWFCLKITEQYLLVTKNDVFSMFSGMLLLHRKTISFKIVIDVLFTLLLLYFPWDDKLQRTQKRDVRSV